MNIKIYKSITFVTAFVLLFGNFFNAHALSGQPILAQTQAFTDNFDNFNSALWASGYMWGANDVNMGNANPANISIVNDANGSSLCLSSPASNNVGAITSVNQYGYGTYTARMKFTASNGTWPSFWAVNGPTGWEIDGHESLGNEPSVYYMTLHDPKDIGQGVYNNQESLAGQWHTYSYTWTATDVTFYFDNEIKYSQAYSKPELVNVTFTMGIMGNGVIWSGNQYDSTTFANGVPTLCLDYFSYTPLGASSTNTPTVTPSTAPSITPSSAPSPIPTSTVAAPAFTPTATASLPILTASPIPGLPTNTPGPIVLTATQIVTAVPVSTNTSMPTLTALPNVSSVITVADPKNLLVGETSLVTVSLNNVPTDGYRSIEFTCTYPPSLIEVSNVLVVDLFGADPVSALIGPQNGSFIIAISGSNGKRASTNDIAFTFNAKALQTGSTVIECTARVSRGDMNLENILSVPDTVTVLENPPAATPVPAPVLTGQVLATKPVTVRLFNADVSLAATTTTNPDGTFSLTAPAGVYTVIASAEGYLDSQGSATLVDGVNTVMPVISLPAGDIDGNDVIDQYDAMTLGMNYNIVAPASAELNNDGITNILDLEMLSENYRKAGALAW